MRGNYRPALKLLGQLEGKELSEFSALLKGIEGLAKKAGDFVAREAKEFGIPVGVAAVAGGIAAVAVDTLGVGGGRCLLTKVTTRRQSATLTPRRPI